MLSDEQIDALDDVQMADKILLIGKKLDLSDAECSRLHNSTRQRHISIFESRLQRKLIIALADSIEGDDSKES